jgi:hypothetical protein
VSLPPVEQLAHFLRRPRPGDCHPQDAKGERFAVGHAELLSSLSTSFSTMAATSSRPSFSAYTATSLVGLDPVGGVGLAGVESLFVGIDCTLAAEHNPEIVGGAGDQSSVVVKGGLVLKEEVFEQREEFFGVLILEEESFGGAAVLEMVQAEQGFRS